MAIKTCPSCNKNTLEPQCLKTIKVIDANASVVKEFQDAIAEGKDADMDQFDKGSRTAQNSYKCKNCGLEVMDKI